MSSSLSMARRYFNKLSDNAIVDLLRMATETYCSSQEWDDVVESLEWLLEDRYNCPKEITYHVAELFVRVYGDLIENIHEATAEYRDKLVAAQAAKLIK